MHFKAATINSSTENQPLISNLRGVAFAFGLISFLVGVLVLIGWQFNILALQTVFSEFTPMNPLSAVEFILCGLSIVLSSFNFTKYCRHCSVILALVAFILAAMRLLDFSPLTIPIDSILFSAKLADFNPASIMPAIGANNFLLISAALMTLDIKIGKRYPAQYFAIICGYLGLLMTMAYLFGANLDSALFLFRPLAFHSALTFMILSLAVLFLRPRQGVMQLIASTSRGGILTRNLMPVAIFLPIFFATAVIIMVDAKYFDFRFGVALTLLMSFVFFELYIFVNGKKLAQADEEREKYERELVQAKIFNEALIDSIGDSVVATNRQGNVILFNKEAEKMFGIKEEDAIGKSVFKLWDISDYQGNILPRAKRPLQITISTGKKTRSNISEPHYYSFQGKRFPVSIVVTPFIFEGKIAGAIDVFHDITADVQIDQAKSSLVSFASHQLRTPTTAISWLIESFITNNKDRLDAGQMAILNDIYRSNRQVAELINDFLNVARIEFGFSDVKICSVEIVREIQEDLRQILQGVSDGKVLEITEKYDEAQFCNIMADKNLIHLVIDNIISNAVKYTPNGGKVDLQFHRVKAGDVVGGKVIESDTSIFSVVDTGLGIPAGEHDNVFERFYRASNVRNINISGTGLGLYMTKLFLEKMGGEIWFKSEVGKGTEFYVRFS